MSGSADPWPLELTFESGGSRLLIAFDDGASFALPYELLRVESPSAEVQGHGAGRRKLVAGKRGVGVVKAEPVGAYAVRLFFDDGHDTGLFSWDYLRELGETADAKWAAYEAELAAAGLSRDP